MTVYRFFILICGIVFFLNTTNAREKETVSTLSIAELVLQKALDNIDLGLYPGSLLMHGMSELTLIHPEKEVML